MLEHVNHYHTSGYSVHVAQPQTPIGVLRQCESLEDQFGRARDQAGVDLVMDVAKIIKPYVSLDGVTKDDSHAELGSLAHSIFESTKKMLKKDNIRNREFGALGTLDTAFPFDVTEKIRELINIHARRSRYLY